MAYKDKHQRTAYRNGWAVCAHGSPRQPRPSYHTHEEREAYDRGWDDCAERLALGYAVGPARPDKTGDTHAQGA